MRDAVIVSPVRTAVGKRNGALSEFHPADLGAIVLRELERRTGIDPVLVDDVIWGCVSQVAEQSFNIARTTVLAAGWPETVPATTVDRQCGSSQQALHFAAAGVVAGHYEIAVAGGVESMSRVPMGSPALGADPLGAGYVARYGEGLPSQGRGAERIAREHDFTRRDLDEFAARSHARAAAATDAARFVDQIVPVDLSDGTTLSIDQGVRPGSTVESLAALPPAFEAAGRLHAGNSSQISDGAAAMLVMTAARARELGLEPVARLHTAVVAADDPQIMLMAPIPATRLALGRSGLPLDAIGAFEVNEAFASVPLAWLRAFPVDPERLNPNGGAIALGHPLGASGARLTTTLLHHMQAEGIEYGLQTMCEGGGLANATIFQLAQG